MLDSFAHKVSLRDDDGRMEDDRMTLFKHGYIHYLYKLTMTRTENDQNILSNISHNDHGSSFLPMKFNYAVLADIMLISQAFAGILLSSKCLSHNNNIIVR
jgi:hypothetical protein